jgi:hypothetical protein
MSINPYETPRETNDLQPEDRPSKVFGAVALSLGLLTLALLLFALRNAFEARTVDWRGAAIAMSLLGTFAGGLMTFGIGRLIESERTENVGGIVLLGAIALLGLALLGAAFELFAN